MSTFKQEAPSVLMVLALGVAFGSLLFAQMETFRDFSPFSLGAAGPPAAAVAVALLLVLLYREDRLVKAVTACIGVSLVIPWVLALATTDLAGPGFLIDRMMWIVFRDLGAVALVQVPVLIGLVILFSVIVPRNE